tara:strand:+ start:2235 stop:2564 length:330 start_codon:yes stop_codon:yes gene_type:complete
MIIYNETINIDESIHLEWREWMQEYIPHVLATGLFSKLVFSKVLITEEMGGTSYSLQHYAYSKAALEAYHKQYAQKIQSEGIKRFGEKMLVFRTELEFIDEIKASNNGC